VIGAGSIAPSSFWELLHFAENHIPTDTGNRQQDCDQASQGHVETYCDKLYRVTQTRTNDPEGAIYARHRVRRQGPHQESLEPVPVQPVSPDAWTYSSYDAVDRIVFSNTTTFT